MTPTTGMHRRAKALGAGMTVGGPSDVEPVTAAEPKGLVGEPDGTANNACFPCMRGFATVSFCKLTLNEIRSATIKF
jgi:hypothetical protein